MLRHCVLVCPKSHHGGGLICSACPVITAPQGGFGDAPAALAVGDPCRTVCRDCEIRMTCTGHFLCQYFRRGVNLWGLTHSYESLVTGVVKVFQNNYFIVDGKGCFCEITCLLCL